MSRAAGVSNGSCCSGCVLLCAIEELGKAERQKVDLDAVGLE